MDSNFSFLSKEFSLLANLGTQAERYIHDDPNAAIYKMRLLGEKMVEIIFEIHQLDFPFENTAFRRLQLLIDEGILEDKIASLLHTIRKSGNEAVHAGKGVEEAAISLLFSVFKISKWFYDAYSDKAEDISQYKFHTPQKIEPGKDYSSLEHDYMALESRFNLLLKDREIGLLSQEKSTEIKQRAVQAALKIEMSEAETRYLIDDQLRSAGWEADTRFIPIKTVC